MQNTILVLDRDANTQVLLFRLLAQAGYVVTSAGDGAEAIVKIGADRPGLIIANVALPGKSGVEICQYVKGRPDPIPVILLAPSATLGPIEPADVVIGLPIDTGKLLQAVRDLLRAEAAQHPPAHAREKILVIDDDLAILNLLKNILVNEGYEVVTADSGREGLAGIERDRPNLILLDVQMPGMNGFEVLAKIRQTCQDLPVIMVTAYGSEDVAADALRFGADDYIAKPLRIRNLCFRIERNLEKSRLRASQDRLNQQLRETTLELTARLQDVIEANSAFRRLLHRVLGDLHARLVRDGMGGEAIGILERLRSATESGDPAASYEDIAKLFGEASKPGS